MEFLAQQDEKQKDRSITLSKPQDDSACMFEVFIQNAKTLSPAEKSVFDLQDSQDVQNGHCGYGLSGFLFLFIYKEKPAVRTFRFFGIEFPIAIFTVFHSAPPFNPPPMGRTLQCCC